MRKQTQFCLVKPIPAFYVLTLSYPAINYYTDCYEPIGLYDGRIPDDAITSSNTASNTTNLAHHGRLDLGSQLGK